GAPGRAVEVPGGALGELADSRGRQGVADAPRREPGELHPASLGEAPEEDVRHAQGQAGPAGELALRETGSVHLRLADGAEEGEFVVVEVGKGLLGHGSRVMRGRPGPGGLDSVWRYVAPRSGRRPKLALPSRRALRRIGCQEPFN